MRFFTFSATALDGESRVDGAPFSTDGALFLVGQSGRLRELFLVPVWCVIEDLCILLAR